MYHHLSNSNLLHLFQIRNSGEVSQLHIQAKKGDHRIKDFFQRCLKEDFPEGISGSKKCIMSFVAVVVVGFELVKCRYLECSTTPLFPTTGCTIIGALHLQLVNGFGDRMQSALVMPSLHFECIGNAPFPCHCAWKVVFKNPPHRSCNCE